MNAEERWTTRQSGTSQGCKPRCWVSVTENQLPDRYSGRGLSGPIGR
jgi:hypothetical protein